MMMETENLLIPPVSETVYAFRARRSAEPGLFYTGPLWYAHVCHALGVGADGDTLGALGLLVAPLEMGVGEYQCGETAHLRVLRWGNCSAERLELALGRAAPAVAHSFTEAFSYVGPVYNAPAEVYAKEMTQLRLATALLATQETVTLRFQTPARINAGYVRRPHNSRSGYIKKARAFVDERAFSLRAVLRACWARLCAMNGRVFTDPESPDFKAPYRFSFDGGVVEAVPLPADCEDLVKDVNLMWLRAPYSKSRRDEKDIGGLVGEVRISPGLPPFWLYCLLAAGRRHVGAFTSFGFGRLEALEARETYAPGMAAAPVSLLDRAAGLQRLRTAAAQLGGTAADVHGVTPSDVAFARAEWFQRLRNRLLAGEFTPDLFKPYRFPKKDAPGECREICVPGAADRVAQRSVHDLLAPGVDALLATASFAYRRGLNREGAIAALERARRDGYTLMVKADIAAFFDRVTWPLVARRLRLLYGDDPITVLIMNWVKTPVARASGPVARTGGLPQGMALSPLLANLLLDILDTELEQHDLRLVRFCDDFVLLLRPESDAEQALGRVREILAGLGLALREDKTRIFEAGAAFTFLGYQVTAGPPAPDPAPPDEPDPMPPFSIFSPAVNNKRTVYLGGKVRGARCKNETLVLLNAEYEPVAHLPWKQVGRIIVSGRVATTGAVQRMALQKGVPTLYLNLWGQALGEAVPAWYMRPGLAAAQLALVHDPERRLQLVRDTVAARLHNVRIVLRRHDIEDERFRDYYAKALEADTVETARGYEGAAARLYWEYFAGLVAPFPFPGRQYRPPKDPVNAMLSFLYTMLHHRMACLLRDQGFDPARGFFHEPRAGHAALASDMMEEFRHFMEWIVLRLVRQRIIQIEWFTPDDLASETPCKLPDQAFRLLVGAFEARMQKPFLGRKKQTLALAEWMVEQIRDLRAALLLEQPRTPLRSD